MKVALALLEQALGSESGVGARQQTAGGDASSLDRGERLASMRSELLHRREAEILRLIASGLSNRQIAYETVSSVNTIKWHIKNVYGKLGVRSRTQAIVRARELGLI